MAFNRTPADSFEVPLAALGRAQGLRSHAALMTKVSVPALRLGSDCGAGPRHL